MVKPYIIAIGSGEIDHFYKASRWPFEGEQLEVIPLENYVGGLIANAACVMAAYGDKTYLMGYTDTSSDGTFILKSLENNKIDLTYHIVHENYRIIQCSIYLMDGERNIFVSVPNDQMTLHFTEEQIQALGNSRFIYTTMSRLCMYDNGVDAIAKARQNGALLCLDLESYIYSEVQLPFLHMADILFVNDHDFQHFSNGAKEKDFCRTFIKNGLQILCVTKGAEGGTVYTENGTFDYKAPKVKAVDTTGAGDTFNASFLHGLMTNKSIEDSADFAAMAAARAVTIMGPHGGIASEKSVLEFAHMLNR